MEKRGDIIINGSTFTTTNEYLNSLISNKYLNPDTHMLNIHRSIMVDGRPLNITLNERNVFITVDGYSEIPFKYRHIDEGLLSHIAKRIPLPDHEYLQFTQTYHYDGIEIVFRCYRKLHIIYDITIDNTIIIRTVKYGDSIDEVINKYIQLVLAIYNNYIKPIGNITPDNEKVIRWMFNHETLIMPKSARSR